MDQHNNTAAFDCICFIAAKGSTLTNSVLLDHCHRKFSYHWKLKLFLICYLCYKYQVENAVSHLLIFKKCIISRYNVTCWVCIWPFCILYLVFVTQATDKWWFWLSVLAKLPMAVVKYNWFCQSASFGCNEADAIKHCSVVMLVHLPDMALTISINICHLLKIIWKRFFFFLAILNGVQRHHLFLFVVSTVALFFTLLLHLNPYSSFVSDVGYYCRASSVKVHFNSNLPLFNLSSLPYLYQMS